MTEKSSQTALSIGVLGSCRVHNPIKEIDSLGRVTYVPSAPIRFLHNPLELVHALKILHGRAEIPADLMPLSCQARALTDERNYQNSFGRTDVLMCEISSVRIAQYQGHQLQINLLRNFLKDAGMSQEGLREMHATNRGLAQEVLTDSLAQDILDKGAFYELSSEQIKDALAQLMKLIDRPVIFVGFVEDLEDGRKIKQRTIVNTAVAEFTKSHPKTHFFNPTSLIAKYGFHTVVRDMGHYQDEFVPTVGDELVAETQSFFEALNIK